MVNRLLHMFFARITFELVVPTWLSLSFLANMRGNGVIIIGHS